MSDNLKEYLRLRKVVEDAQARTQREQGRYDAELARLKKDFGVSTIKEAKRKLAKLEAREQRLHKTLEEMCADWIAQFEKQNGTKHRN